jgi:hypothetical protein
LLILIFFINYFAFGDETKLNEQDAYLLIDKLLSLSEKSSDQKVELERSLERYKKWGELYTIFSNNEEMTKNKMKIYLFMTFIAHERTMIDPQEEIAEGIVPIFTRRPEIMLSVLKELPFLVPSTCTSLNDHFDLYDKKEAKQQFIKKYEGDILKSLSKEQAKTCLDKLKK